MVSTMYEIIKALNKIKFLKITVIVLCAMLLLASCKMLLFSSGKNDKNSMTMTTAKKGEVVIYATGSGVMTINWGNGTKSKARITALERNDTLLNNHRYSHTYSKASANIITISGENITLLGCWDNQLTELDVSKNSVLTRLACDNNQLTELDVSKNYALTGLGCNNNKLTKLDVSKNYSLTILNCGDNPLTELDVNKNIVLASLFCYNNQLEKLDVKGAFSLRRLECWNNLLEAPMLNDLFVTLNRNHKSSIVIGGNPGASDCDQSIAESKGWIVQ